MKDEQFTEWRDLLRALRDSNFPRAAVAFDNCRRQLVSQTGTKETVYVRSDRDESKAAEAAENEQEGGAAARQEEQKKPETLTVHFADYALTRSIDTVISYISYERAREASDERLLYNDIIKQMDECSGHISRYSDLLKVPKENSKKQQPKNARAAKAALPPAPVSKHPPLLADVLFDVDAIERNREAWREYNQWLLTKPARNSSRKEPTKLPDMPFDPSKTIVQLVILRLAAAMLRDDAADDKSLAERNRKSAHTKLDEEIAARIAGERAAKDVALAAALAVGKAAPVIAEPVRETPQEKTDRQAINDKWDREIEKAEDKREHFDVWWTTFDVILATVARSEERLAELRAEVDDEKLRRRIAKYVGPIAKRLDRAPVIRMGISFTLLMVIGLATLGAVYAAGNVLWPFFGWPAIQQLVVLAIASAVGAYLLRDPITKSAVTKQREDLRKHFENILRADDTKPSDILEKLGHQVKVGDEDLSTGRPGQRGNFRFEGVGLLFKKDEAIVKVRKPLLWAVRFIYVFVSAATAIVPTYLTGATMHSWGWMADNAVEIVRVVDRREVCRVTSGRVVWQDKSAFYLLPAKAETVKEPDQPVASGAKGAQWFDFQTLSDWFEGLRRPTIIAKTDATEIRALRGDDTVADCMSLSSNFGAANGDVVNVPVTVPISVPAPQGENVGRGVLDLTSRIIIDGQEVQRQDASPAWRYVVVPLVRVPVKGFDYTTPTGTTRDEIYRFYRTTKDVDGADPGFSDPFDEVQRAVAPIKAALDLAAKTSRCDINIDVVGYASDKDFEDSSSKQPDVTDAESQAEREARNHYLAEGRRAAVLFAMGFGESDDIADRNANAASGAETARGRLMLVSSDGPSTSPPAANGYARPFRFNTPGEMVDHLRKWNGSVVPEDATRYQEALARSVVIGISAANLACTEKERLEQERLAALRLATSAASAEVQQSEQPSSEPSSSESLAGSNLESAEPSAYTPEPKT